VCAHCNASRDLDLCRDPNLTRPLKSERWLCGQCHAPYDKDQVELRLVEGLQRRSTRFQLQDLRCSKCKQVAKRQMGLHCPCSGLLSCDDTPQSFAEDLAVIAKVATFHDFEWLAEVAASLAH
jgi:DNA polymerase epsilon subunit 1